MKKYALKENQDLTLKNKDHKRLDAFIVVFGITSVLGFLVSILFLIGITGGVVGTPQGNLSGLIFIIIPLLIWSILNVLKIKRRKKELNIQELLKETETQP